MNQQQEQPIDLRDTDILIRNEVGYLIPVVIERTVSKFVTGKTEDTIIRMNVFMDPVSKKIVEDTIPEAVREEYSKYSIDLPGN